MALRTFPIPKDNTSWDHYENDQKKGAGAEQHWLGGRFVNRQWFTHARADCDWSGVALVTRATLILEGDEDHIATGNQAPVYLKRIKTGQSWTEGNAPGRPIGVPTEDWESDEYEKPAVVDDSLIRATATGGMAQTRIDVIAFLPHWAPQRVAFMVGGSKVNGRWSDATEASNKNEGFRIGGNTEAGKGWEFCSSDHTQTSRRPVIEIEFTPPNQAPFASAINPRDDTLEDEEFQVGFSDPDLGDTFSKYQIQARRVGQTELRWETTNNAGTQEREEQIGRVRIPLNMFNVGIQYEWRCRVWDQTGTASGWTGWFAFQLTGNAPTIATRTLGTISTLDGVRFIADWSHPDARPILSLRIQLRGSTPAGSPLWDGQDNVWDTGDVSPTSGELSTNQVNRDYKGDSLLAGAYSWRVMVRDRLGVDSLWAYDDFTLEGDYDPNPEDYAYLPGYERSLHAYRIVLRDMGENRKPGAIKAIIEDAANVGASMYVNAPGEVYFTLPATHWQVGECEPYQRHYAIEQYVGGAWKERFAGVLTDFDATGDDCVIYGMDYLGLLSIDIERRHGEKLVEDGGAKYGKKKNTSRNWRISEIIEDQLVHARDVSHSTTGFISPGRIDSLAEEAMINASFRPRLEFIRGLIDSSRAGTGQRTRLALRRARVAGGPPGNHEWHLLKNAGKNRPELKMEFGGIIQGFRVVAMGDFAIKGFGIGRKVNELTPHYASDTAGTGSRQEELLSRYGNLAKVTIWNDIAGATDLQRRVQQMTAESSTVGKRLALGLRVHAISPFDGWDLLDLVPIAINRGVVHTGLYGSGTPPPPATNPATGEPYDYGWWVIWGTEWRLYPDGHDEVTLVVRPKEDDIIPSGDLIPDTGLPITSEWTYGVGSPDQWFATDVVKAGPGAGMPKTTYYVDQSTGAVWVLQPDGETYLPHGNNWADPTSPSTPQGLIAIAGFKSVGLTWSRPAELDLDYFGVRWTTDLAGAPNPDNWVTTMTHGTSIVVGDLVPEVPYWFEIRAVDRLGTTATSLADPTPVNADENPDAGWSLPVGAIPSKVGVTDLAVGTVVADFMTTGTLSADHIFGGTLTVGQAGIGAVIEVFDGSGRLTARWNESGLLIIDPNVPGRAIWIAAGEMRVTNAFTGDVATSLWTNSVTAEGINASAIRFGSTPGGHNLIPNSGFEVTAFTTLLSKIWTVAADWATALEQVNVNLTTADLTLTTATY